MLRGVEGMRVPAHRLPEVARGLVVARAPARLDFGGGWTDVPPYSDEQGGCVCNVAITRRATACVAADARRAGACGAPGRREADTRLADAALRHVQVAASAAVFSDFPVSAGLGGSSAAGVALAAAAAAWRGELATATPDDALRVVLAERSRAAEVEEVGIPGGRQDHYAAAFGGALRIDFGAAAGGAPARVTRLPLTPETRAGLERRAVVVYTGESRISGSTITAVVDAYRAREARVMAALARMRALAEELASALAGGDIDALGGLLAEHWTHQRALHPTITTPRIDALMERGARAGALGGKALGASAGGCVLLLAAEGREEEVRAATAGLGEVLDFAIDEEGVRVEWVAD
jgi:D-glycero-alpha-D-manno-heptose-7-phosphate kinase